MTKMLNIGEEGKIAIDVQGVSLIPDEDLNARLHQISVFACVDSAQKLQNNAVVAMGLCFHPRLTAYFTQYLRLLVKFF